MIWLAYRHGSGLRPSPTRPEIARYRGASAIEFDTLQEYPANEMLPVVAAMAGMAVAGTVTVSWARRTWAPNGLARMGGAPTGL
jgi:hypothetical protein